MQEFFRRWSYMKKKKATNEKMSLGERLTKALDIPPDVLPASSSLNLRGRNALTVSGCKKIVSYSPENIRLDLGESILSITGKRLICSSYHTDATGVEGLIVSIAFENKGEGEP